MSDTSIHIDGNAEGNTIVAGTGNIVGVPPEDFKKLSKELGIAEYKLEQYSKDLEVTAGALKAFFKILEQQNVPPMDLDSKLREVAEHYKELQSKLASFQSDDPAVMELKTAARESLDNGDFDNAEELINQAKTKDIESARQMQKFVNKRFLSAAESAAENGDLKKTQFKYRKAAEYFKEAADLVPQGEELVRSGYLDKCGKGYWRAGMYVEAIGMVEKALEIHERELPEDHANVSASLNNLALLYNNQGEYEKAEHLYQRSLKIKEKVYGPEHEATATTLNNLAELYRDQGKYAEAEPLYKRSLAIREKVLGPEHPNVATSLNNLAVLYKDQGKYAEAEPLYKRSLAIWEKVLGPEHPHVATSLNNLAELYRVQGRYDEAEPMYKRSLAIREKVLGPQHPDVAYNLNNLAMLYESQGDFKKAEPLFQRALKIFNDKLGPDHPNTKTVKANYDDMLKNLAKTKPHQLKQATF